MFPASPNNFSSDAALRNVEETMKYWHAMITKTAPLRTSDFVAFPVDRK